MKEKPILFLAIAITLIIELVLIIMVYNKVGAERLDAQIGRLFIQLFFIFLITILNSKKGIFLLTGYHIFTAFIIWNSKNSQEIMVQTLAIYHLIIGFIIYFHDWIEAKIKFKI